MNRHQRRVQQKQPAGGAPAGQSIFSAAYRFHQAGDLAAAERLYQQFLAAQPRHADALHLLGVVALQTGRPALAESRIRQAIAVDPHVAGYHSNLGTLLSDAGRPDEAAVCYRRAIALRPDLPEAYANLGNALRDLGKPEDAIAAYHLAIARRPDLAEAQLGLGGALRAQGQIEAAIGCYRRAVAARPDLAEAHNTLGAALREQGACEEAAACCRQAIALNPAYAEACNNLANALRQLGRLEDATTWCRRALALKEALPEAHNTLASLLLDQGEAGLDAASDSCRRALALRPDYAEAHSNLGNVLREQGRLEAAIGCYRRAIELQPDLLEAHNNLGTALREQGRVTDAIACYRTALVLDAAHPDLHINLAMALLALGDLPAGWEEYEWRWQTPAQIRDRQDFGRPLWRGEAAAGQTLLIHAEQGLGDTLQFCRYATLAAARGLHVALQVPRPLVRLMRAVRGVDLVVETGVDLPPFAWQCPMLSLPRALGTTLATIPAPGAYLQADDARVADWRARLAGEGRRRIGLAWAGNPRRHSPALAAVDRRRSIAPALLAPLCDVPGVALFSLQKDGPKAPFPLIDFMSEMADFADTAALIANLDLIISVDTAVAHLAAGLGKPVWLLDRFDPCWRWLTGRRDSPWYPSLRLYRQPKPGDWPAVIAEIAGDLSRV